MAFDDAAHVFQPRVNDELVAQSECPRAARTEERIGCGRRGRCRQLPHAKGGRLGAIDRRAIVELIQERLGVVAHRMAGNEVLNHDDVVDDHAQFARLRRGEDAGGEHPDDQDHR